MFYSNVNVSMYNIIVEFGIIILEVAYYGYPQLLSKLLDKLGFLLIKYYCYSSTIEKYSKYSY